MKRLLGLLILLGILGAIPAHAVGDDGKDRNDGSKQIGLYVGGKLGMSIEQFTGSKFGMKEGGASFPPPFGDLSWKDQLFGMGTYKDTVFGGGVLLGYDFHKRFAVPIRVELDYTLRGKASDTNQRDLPFEYTSLVYGDFSGVTSARMKTSLTLQTLMANAWWDIFPEARFTPYVGGGLGVAFGRLKATVTDVEEGDTLKTSDTFTNFAWSLGGGLAYDFNDNWTLDLGYRYIDAGDHKMTYNNDVNYVKIDRIETHDVMLGIRYTF